jgi:pilus assembly protein CpaF
MKLSERVERVEIDRARANGKATTKKRSPRTRSTPDRWGQMKRQVRDTLIADLGPKLYKRGDTDLRSVVNNNLDDALRRCDITLVASQRAKFVAEVAADLLGYGPLDPLLADPATTEIMCNGFDEIYIEQQGKIVRTTASFIDEAQFRQVIEKIVAGAGRRTTAIKRWTKVVGILPDNDAVRLVLRNKRRRGQHSGPNTMRHGGRALKCSI